MFIKKHQRDHSDKKYYILDSSFAIIPVDDYKFNKTEDCLKSLVNDECFTGNYKAANEKIELDKLIKEIGFKWEPLSESGHMRHLPYAVTIMEAIEKNVWSIVENFSNEQNISLYRISGGELFDSSRIELKRQISSISKNLMYGTNQYNVVANKKKQILRYSACTQKLSIAKEINFCNEDFPVGLFEISKSYRFEEENELQLCKRVRNFHLPELHIINDSLASSLKIAFAAHIKILDEIKKLDPEYELLCSVTDDFYKANIDFLKIIVKSINKPILLEVYNEGVCCENGIKVDIEYKVFDTLRSPVEIATFQVDDGTTEFSFDIKYQIKNSVKKPVSTIHTVFPFGSVERSAYFLIDRSIKKEAESGFNQLPFWVTPIQARIIACNKRSLEYAKNLAKELNLLNFRVDLDDREIPFIAKKKAGDLKLIPYIIMVNKNSKGLQELSIENKRKKVFKGIIRKSDLIKKMNAEENRNIIVPRYVPMLLSKRVIFKS